MLFSLAGVQGDSELSSLCCLPRSWLLIGRTNSELTCWLPVGRWRKCSVKQLHGREGCQKPVKSESTGCSSQGSDALTAESFNCQRCFNCLRAGKPPGAVYVALISFRPEKPSVAKGVLPWSRLWTWFSAWLQRLLELCKWCHSGAPVKSAACC